MNVRLTHVLTVNVSMDVTNINVIAKMATLVSTVKQVYSLKYIKKNE